MKESREFVDHTGHRVVISFPPKRIVSLVPSQTELLLDLGLGSRIVGRTKFCIHPRDKVGHVQVVGGTKNVRIDAVRKLQPDLVIGNREENLEESVAELRKTFPVWISDIAEVKDAIDLVSSFGEMTATTNAANYLKAEISDALDTVKGKFTGNVLYLIWKSPWMAAGTNTFINAMIEWLGFSNAIKKARYPELDANGLAGLSPDFVFLSSEPYPFKAPQVEELRTFYPFARIHLVDGEMFSWYGSRLVKLPEYFAQLKTRLSG